MYGVVSVCRVRSLSLFGIDALPVEVEVDVGAGLPGFSIVGLPDAAVQEARERVRVAISNSGYKFPTKKVIVNLAPANLRKEGPAFDLPIALAVLAASGVVPQKGLEQVGVVGELSLDGSLRGGGAHSRWPRVPAGKDSNPLSYRSRTPRRRLRSADLASTGCALSRKRWALSRARGTSRRQHLQPMAKERRNR